MGKSLKGKELGKGIGQRKDGLYYARCTDKAGKRLEKCFQNLRDAQNWQKEQQFHQLYPSVKPKPVPMTVNAWEAFWRENLLTGLAANTIRNYRERYEKNIKPILGDMLLTDVKPMHCKTVLNSMNASYAGSTIRQTYITMGTMFKAAKENGLIDTHPLDGVRFEASVKAPDEIHFLTVAEQAKFMEAAKRSHNYAQYA